MEYGISTLSQMAGISTRTLRYYDQIGLLRPLRVSASGYRVYGQKQVDRLQQILFYRELGMELSEIKKLLQAKDYDPVQSLQRHLQDIISRQERLERIIHGIKLAIKFYQGEIDMNDQQKFTAFKRQMIADNAARYGDEVREKYGSHVFDASNQKLMDMGSEQFAHIRSLTEQIMTGLAQATRLGDPSSPEAQKVCALHKEWLCGYWPEYSREAHLNLAEMYVADERFRAYYEQSAPGGAEFLRDALKIFCAENN